MSAGKPQPIRIDDKTLGRIEAVRARMQANVGTALDRSQVLRALLLAGLTELERKFGVVPASPGSGG